MAGKIALVTGVGPERIGWHIAKLLAEHGHSLAVHYRTSAVEAAQLVDETRAAGLDAEAFQADLTQEPQVLGMIDAVLARFGRLDSLVTCAAAWTPKRLEDVTAEDVRFFFETNALSTFLCVQRAGLAMAAQPEGGAIVTFGDWATVRPYLNYAAYFPSKGAVETLTRTMAVELAARNPRVRVNCILPGPVLMGPHIPEAEQREAIAGTLVKHEGNPRDIARAVLHLIENNFVTGVCLPVDGGRSVYAPRGT